MLRSLLVLGCLGLSMAAAPSAAEEAAAKQAELQAMASKAPLSVISEGEFDKLVRSPNRPYHTFVLFNARDPQYQCALCGPFEDEVQVLADSYWRAKGKGADSPPAFFVVADFKNNKRIFSEYNLQSVPMLVHFGPTGAVPHPKNKMPANSQYTSDLDAENAALFVREKIGLKVDIYRSPWGNIAVALVFFGSIFGTLYAKRHALPALVDWFRAQTWFWAMIGLTFYFISVAGVLFDIIRGVPSFGYDPRTRRAIVFAQGSNTQYAVEGLIIGALNLGCGFAVVLLTRVIPRKFAGDSSKLATWGVGAIVAFFLLYRAIERLYKWKNQWYDY